MPYYKLVDLSLFALQGYNVGPINFNIVLFLNEQILFKWQAF